MAGIWGAVFCDSCKLILYLVVLSEGSPEHAEGVGLTDSFISSQVLTSSIVVGWLLLILTLGQYSSLGYFKGAVGGTSV